MGAIKSDTRSLGYIVHIGPYCRAGILGTLKSIYGLTQAGGPIPRFRVWGPMGPWSQP